MSFQVSAGINVSEIDLTTIVPAVSTTSGAIAGVFRWGPVEQRVLIDSESALVSYFGKPTNFNAETFLTAASFLGYGNRLYVSRAANTVGTSPIATTVNTTSTSTTIKVANTTGLSTGMTLINSSANAVPVGATIVTVTAPDTVVLSTAATATSLSGTAQFVTNTAFSAIANSGTVEDLTTTIVKNEQVFAARDIGSYDSDINFVAKYPGELGNSLKVSVCSNPNGYQQSLNISSNAYYFTNAVVTKSTSINIPVNSATATIIMDEVTNGVAESANVNALSDMTNLYNLLSLTDMIDVGTQNLKIISKTVPTAITYDGTNASNTTKAKVSFTLTFDNVLKQSTNVSITSLGTANVLTRVWEYHDSVDASPGLSAYQTNFGNTSVTSDEMHVVVVDSDGKFTGVPGTILETYRAVSRATDAKTIDGAGNYYRDVINDLSNYIYAINDLSGAGSATAANLVSATAGVTYKKFALGKDGNNETNVTMSALANAYDLFKSAEDVDISLVLTGKLPDNSSGQLANYLIDNIAEVRKDCVVFVSPSRADVVNKSTPAAALAAILATRNNLRSTSYAVMDSGYKYVYDRYNDMYRWIPLNGDVAGLCARSDNSNDPWWSPAGINRGQIKNLIRLSYNPAQSERDDLYKAGVNPVVTFPGQGTILYGDKTLLSKPSAFDRINVRRLFIVLEKAIASASRSTLFEFNDAFTRSQFKNLLTPFLRDIQGRRGITDFLVVCDETNNTGEVIDRNEFVGDIYIKPARSINFIQLNFVAVRSGVAFSEVVGQF
jgi:phage tail sheath protein FI